LLEPLELELLEEFELELSDVFELELLDVFELELLDVFELELLDVFELELLDVFELELPAEADWVESALSTARTTASGGVTPPGREPSVAAAATTRPAAPRPAV
jgi:hypothetical protein